MEAVTPTTTAAHSRRTTATRALIRSHTITLASTRTTFTRQETITRTSTATSRSMTRPLHPLTFRTLSQSHRPQPISTTAQDGSTMAPSTITIAATGVAEALTGAGSTQSSQKSSTTITTTAAVVATIATTTSTYHTLKQMSRVSRQHSSSSASWFSSGWSSVTSRRRPMRHEKWETKLLLKKWKSPTLTESTKQMTAAQSTWEMDSFKLTAHQLTHCSRCQPGTRPSWDAKLRSTAGRSNSQASKRDTGIKFVEEPNATILLTGQNKSQTQADSETKQNRTSSQTFPVKNSGLTNWESESMWSTMSITRTSPNERSTPDCMKWHLLSLSMTPKACGLLTRSIRFWEDRECQVKITLGTWEFRSKSSQASDHNLDQRSLLLASKSHRVTTQLSDWISFRTWRLCLIPSLVAQSKTLLACMEFDLI